MSSPSRACQVEVYISCYGAFLFWDCHVAKTVFKLQHGLMRTRHTFYITVDLPANLIADELTYLLFLYGVGIKSLEVIRCNHRSCPP